MTEDPRAPYVASSYPPVRRPRDRDVTLLVFAGYGVLCCLGTLAGLLSMMVSDGCFPDTHCDTGKMMFGVLVAAIGPWVALAVAGVNASRIARAGRPTWWVPLVGAGCSLAVFAAGIGIVVAFGPH